jgi:hypothetical protein
MRAALGYVFAQAGMKSDQVPRFLSEKLNRDLALSSISNGDLEEALTTFTESWKAQAEGK